MILSGTAGPMESWYLVCGLERQTFQHICGRYPYLVHTVWSKHAREAIPKYFQSYELSQASTYKQVSVSVMVGVL